MRLPGTRYQEHGWERVRKLLGACSLLVLRQVSPSRLRSEPLLDWYTDAMALALHQSAKTGRGAANGNSYGDSVVELAQTLVCELRALPAYWDGFIKALGGSGGGVGADVADDNEALLRKRINDMFASLRDKVDADGYQVAQGRPCSPNKMYTYRMLDTAYADIARIFNAWPQKQAQIEAILGYAAPALPLAIKRMHAIQDCRAEWIIRWSATLAQFGASAGPLHTRSKRFSSLKNNPAKIQLLLAEIGEYEALSANLDTDSDWRHDAGQAGDWLEDYWRVIKESEQAEQSDQSGQAASDDEEAHASADLLDHLLDPHLQTDGGPDGIDADLALDGLASDELPYADALDALDNLTADLTPQDALTDNIDDSHDDAKDAAAMLAALRAAGLDDPAVDPVPIADSADEVALAVALSLPPGYIGLARMAEDRASWIYQALQDQSLALRLALYWKELGPWDESYPDDWLDPVTGELPTMKQLAGLDRISLPTLRKRRDAAILRLHQAGALARGGQ
jgi:hypothetical protein